MLHVLNKQAKATALPTNKTNLSLEAAELEIANLRMTNATMGLESLMSTADSYISKLEGLTQMHQLLTVMPKISVESGALIEVASNLLSHGTDLNGAQDLIPSLEAYTQGMEDDSKASGFADTAKRAGEAVLEVIRKIFAKLKELWNKIEDRIAKLKTSFTTVKERVDKGGLKDANLEMEKWAYNGLVDPAGSEIASFINHAKAFTPRVEVPEGKDPGEFYDEVLTEYLKLFSDIGETDKDVIKLIKLDTGTTLTYTVAKFEDGKVVKSGHHDTEERPSKETENVKVTPEILKAGVIKILRVLDDLQSFVESSKAKIPDVKESLHSNNVTETKVTLELARLCSFTFSHVPEVILSNYVYIHSCAVVTVKNMEGETEAE